MVDSEEQHVGRWLRQQINTASSRAPGVAPVSQGSDYTTVKSSPNKFALEGRLNKHFWIGGASFQYLWPNDSLCPEEIPSGCVPCVSSQETAYLLVLWLVPERCNYIGIEPFMSWGQSTTIFPRNEFLPLCGERASPKCHCGI